MFTISVLPAVSLVLTWLLQYLPPLFLPYTQYTFCYQHLSLGLSQEFFSCFLCFSSPFLPPLFLSFLFKSDTQRARGDWLVQNILCRPGWPGTHCVGFAVLKLTEILLPLPPQYWDESQYLFQYSLITGPIVVPLKEIIAHHFPIQKSLVFLIHSEQMMFFYFTLRNLLCFEMLLT